MDKDLILDNGRIRNCPSNKEKMGFLKTFIEFHSYSNAGINIKTGFSDFYMGLIAVILYPILIILFPISPLLHAIFDYISAIKECKRYRKDLM